MEVVVGRKPRTLEVQNKWEKISGNQGFAKGILGIIGVTVSPVNSNRVWAIVEKTPEYKNAELVQNLGTMLVELEFFHFCNFCHFAKK